MANELNYTNIEAPYDSLLQRSGEGLNVGEVSAASSSGGASSSSSSTTNSTDSNNTSNSNGSVETQQVKTDGSMSDIWITNFIRSKNWKPKKQGFYIDGESGYAEFTGVYVSGNIQALTGKIGGFTIGATDLSVTSGANTVIISSGVYAFIAGPTNAPTVTISQSGELVAKLGTIGGWIINDTLLKSEDTGDRIELNKGDNRISVFDATNEKVVMGYLDGLPKHDGTGNWGPSDYGFWARTGDKLSIDGDGEYINGDWIIQDDANYLIKDSSDNTIIRLGTDTGEKGLFIYDTNSVQLAKFISDQIFVGNSTESFNYSIADGLIISEPQICDVLETYENIEYGKLVAITSEGKAIKTNTVVDLPRFYGASIETVNRMEIVNGGTGYATYLYPLSGGDFNCVVATTTSSGVVTKIEVIQTGTGYTEGQTYTLNGGNSDCTIIYKEKNYVKILKSGPLKTTGLTAGKKYKMASTYSDAMYTCMNNYVGTSTDAVLGVGGILYTRKLLSYRLLLQLATPPGAGTYPFKLNFYPVFVSEGGYLADDEFTPTSITSSGTTATITTTRDLNVDDYVYISGADQSEYNGWHKITLDGSGYGEFIISGATTSPATGTLLFKHRPVKYYLSTSIVTSNSSAAIWTLPVSFNSNTIYGLNVGDAMGYSVIFEFSTATAGQINVSQAQKSGIPAELIFNDSSDLYIGMVKDDTRLPFYRFLEYSASGDYVDGTDSTIDIFGIARESTTLLIDKTLLS